MGEITKLFADGRAVYGAMPHGVTPHKLNLDGVNWKTFENAELCVKIDEIRISQRYATAYRAINLGFHAADYIVNNLTDFIKNTADEPFESWFLRDHDVRIWDMWVSAVYDSIRRIKYFVLNVDVKFLSRLNEAHVINLLRIHRS